MAKGRAELRNRATSVAGEPLAITPGVFERHHTAAASAADDDAQFQNDIPDIERELQIKQADLDLARQALDSERAQLETEKAEWAADLERQAVAAKDKAFSSGEQTDEFVSLQIPVAEVPPTAFGMHLDVRLSAKQSLALRSIACGLDRKQVVLENGRRVIDPSNAIRYLLEEVATGFTV